MYKDSIQLWKPRHCLLTNPTLLSLLDEAYVSFCAPRIVKHLHNCTALEQNTGTFRP